MWVQQFLKEAADFELVSYEALAALSRNNIRYAEVLYYAAHYETTGLSVAKGTLIEIVKPF